MKKVSKLITTAALLSMAVVVAACNKGGGGGGGTSQSGTSQSGTSQSGGPSYSFEMWTGFGKDYTSEIDNVVEQYNASHSNVTVTNVKKNNYDYLVNQILNSYSQGLIPDFACGYPDHFAEYLKAGIIVPLDPYIERYNQEHGGDIIADYFPDYMTENRTIGYDDATEEPYTLGIPFNKSTEVMLCNGLYFDFFKSHDSSIKVPTTWAELKEVAPKVLAIVESQHLQDSTNNYIVGKVQKIEGSNHASDFRIIENEDEIRDDEVFIQDITNLKDEKPFYCLGYDSADNAFITILHQWGVPYTEYSKQDYFDNEQYGKALFWKDEYKNATKEALQYFVDINHESRGFAVPGTFGESDFCTTPLEHGRCLFTVGSSGGLNKPKFIDDEATQRAQRLEVHPIPSKDGTHKAVISQGTSLGLLNRIGLVHDFVDNADYQEKMYQAFCAMVAFTTGSLQAQWVTKTGYFPSSISATNDPVYQELINKANPTRLQKLYRDAGRINNQTYDAENWDKFVDPGFAGSNSIRTNVKTVFQQILGTASIDTVMNSVWSMLPPQVTR